MVFDPFRVVDDAAGTNSHTTRPLDLSMTDAEMRRRDDATTRRREDATAPPGTVPQRGPDRRIGAAPNRRTRCLASPSGT